MNRIWLLLIAGGLLAGIDLYRSRAPQSADLAPVDEGSRPPAVDAAPAAESPAAAPEPQLADALAELETRLKRSPEAPDLLLERARLYVQFHRFVEALQDLEKVLERDPASMAALFERASILHRQGRHQEAFQDFTVCAERMEEPSAAFFNRALTRAMLHDMDGAREDLREFLRRSPDEGWKERAREILDDWEGMTAG